MSSEMTPTPSTNGTHEHTNGHAAHTVNGRAVHNAMGPPAVPASGLSHRSPVLTSNLDSNVPLRHPRPLTATELYLECEKEQEAVVNRLTRELTALRAQTASVASNASHSSTSTSASLLPVDISDPNPTHQLTGATHPAPFRRRRRSSSISVRSIPTPSTTASALSTTQAHSGSTGVSQASAARAAAAPGNLSRQPSITASGASTPARRSIDFSRHGQHALPHRPSVSRDTSHASIGASSLIAQAGTPNPQRASSPAFSPANSVQAAMQHYTDATAYRTEMESVKAENEALKQRVRALETALRARRRDSSQSDAARPDLGRHRQSREGVSPSTSAPSSAGIAAWAATSGVGGVAGPRERSESQSTTASSRPGITVDEEVRVGESAASAANAVAHR